jgi:hypothetical protein
MAPRQLECIRRGMRYLVRRIVIEEESDTRAFHGDSILKLFRRLGSKFWFRKIIEPHPH